MIVAEIRTYLWPPLPGNIKRDIARVKLSCIFLSSFNIIHLQFQRANLVSTGAKEVVASVFPTRGFVMVTGIVQKEMMKVQMFVAVCWFYIFLFILFF